MAKKKTVCLEKNLRNEIEEFTYVGGKLDFPRLYKMAQQEIQHADWCKKSYRKKKYTGQLEEVVEKLAKEFLNLSKESVANKLKEYGKYSAASYTRSGDALREHIEQLGRNTRRIRRR